MINENQKIFTTIKSVIRIKKSFFLNQYTANKLK